MKTVIVACGGGIATSTVIVDEIVNLAKQNRIKVNIVQCTLNEMQTYFGEADLVVTSSPMRGQLPIPYIVGTSFITGIGMEDTKAKILEILQK